MNDVTPSSFFTALTASGGGKLPPPIVETVAGLTAGTVSTLVLHPLDLIKVRLQGVYDFVFIHVQQQFREVVVFDLLRLD